jgi:hypothetical protein
LFIGKETGISFTGWTLPGSMRKVIAKDDDVKWGATSRVLGLWRMESRMASRHGDLLSGRKFLAKLKDYRRWRKPIFI